jgi:hypothetical protein
MKEKPLIKEDRNKKSNRNNIDEDMNNQNLRTFQNHLKLLQKIEENKHLYPNQQLIQSALVFPHQYVEHSIRSQIPYFTHFGHIPAHLIPDRKDINCD